jgi:hypothetical protein
VPATKAHTLLDEIQQDRIELPDHPSGEPLAGLGKRLRSHLTLEIGRSLEVGAESVEFLLDAATRAGEHKRQQFRERQVAIAEKDGG